jgi:hypothetical protein
MELYRLDLALSRRGLVRVPKPLNAERALLQRPPPCTANDPARARK